MGKEGSRSVGHGPSMPAATAVVETQRRRMEEDACHRPRAVGRRESTKAGQRHRRAGGPQTKGHRPQATAGNSQQPQAGGSGPAEEGPVVGITGTNLPGPWKERRETMDEDG